MKTFKIFFVMLLAMNAIASKAQESKGNPTQLGDCPPGYHPIITITVEQFNFHRPKYNCERGFSLCIRGVYAGIDCTPDRSAFAPFFKDEFVHGYAVLLEGQIELHLPAALADLPEYAKDDMSVFSVEEEGITLYVKEEKVATLKHGDYKVQRVEEELVILIDLE
jgi:hypothetical protein